MGPAKALTIAGSDSGGGAGIQADLKTFQERDVYGMSVLTAVTAQNTIGVQGVYPVSVEGVVEQLRSIGEDLPPQAVKTGMLFSTEIIEAVAHEMKTFNWSTIVIDPVMIAKGGASLLQQEATNALKEKLLPLATVVTPNIPEAEVLADCQIRTLEDKKEAAKRLHALGADHVIIKGGHEDTKEVIDLLFDGQSFYDFKSERVATPNTHGTGCTFSAALTAELAKGASVFVATALAKQFIQAAISHDLGIGHGHGPTNHWAYRQFGRGSNNGANLE
jgi:hydroxymethylpyrimidine/phosphomethylpyrimidine kinase